MAGSPDKNFTLAIAQEVTRQGVDPLKQTYPADTLSGTLDAAIALGNRAVMTADQTRGTTLTLAAGKSVLGGNRGDGVAQTITSTASTGIRMLRNNRVVGVNIVRSGGRAGVGVDLTDSYWPMLSDMRVIGWDVGVRAERLLYSDWGQVDVRDCRVGVLFAANNGGFNLYDPPGYFNNVVQIPILNCVNNAQHALEVQHALNLHVEHLDVTGTGSVAGTNGQRSAVLIGPKTHSVSLPHVYAEALFAGTNAIEVQGGHVTVGGFFQGGGTGAGARSGAVIRATGGTTIVESVTGSDYWTRLIDADGPQTVVIVRRGALKGSLVFEVERVRATNGATVIIEDDYDIRTLGSKSDRTTITTQAVPTGSSLTYQIPAGRAVLFSVGAYFDGGSFLHSVSGGATYFPGVGATQTHTRNSDNMQASVSPTGLLSISNTTGTAGVYTLTVIL